MIWTSVANGVTMMSTGTAPMADPVTVQEQLAAARKALDDGLAKYGGTDDRALVRLGTAIRQLIRAIELVDQQSHKAAVR